MFHREPRAKSHRKQTKLAEEPTNDSRQIGDERAAIFELPGWQMVTAAVPRVKEAMHGHGLLPIQVASETQKRGDDILTQSDSFSTCLRTFTQGLLLSARFHPSDIRQKDAG